MIDPHKGNHGIWRVDYNDPLPDITQPWIGRKVGFVLFLELSR